MSAFFLNQSNILDTTKLEHIPSLTVGNNRGKILIPNKSSRTYENGGPHCCGPPTERCRLAQTTQTATDEHGYATMAA